MAHIEGQTWELYKNEDGTYLHLYKDTSKIALSIGHPEDTMGDLLASLLQFLEQSQSELKLDDLNLNIV